MTNQTKEKLSQSLKRYHLEKLKTKALTDLYNSGKLHDKVYGICERHGIPIDSDIKSDVLQVTFENLAKYNTEKFVEAYKDNPNRILALAVRIAVVKGVLVDKRIPGGFNHSIAQNILHQSNFKSLLSVNTVVEDDTDYFNVCLVAEEDEEEVETSEMWRWVMNRISNHERIILATMLKEHPPKLKGKDKKIYFNLLPKLKTLITEFKNNNQQ